MVEIVVASSQESDLFSRPGGSITDTVLSRSFFGFWTTESWRPDVNLYESRLAFLVCVDLAGMDKSDIDVRVDKNQLIIRGRRTCPMPSEHDRAVAVHLMEIDHGSFSRSLEMPSNVDEKAISAHYDTGLLWITLPKASGGAIHHSRKHKL